MPNLDSYVICTAPRSGSTLLCRLLQNTGIAGWPDSHFHKPDLDAWMQAHGLHRAAYRTQTAALRATLAAAQHTGRGGTRLFGLRLQKHSAAYFFEQLQSLAPDAPSDHARFEALFGRTAFIHLTRENKLDQAISRIKAEQTGLWHRAPDGTELERLAPPAAPRYDRAAIASAQAEFVQADQQWRNWFTAQNIAPLTITYDALARDPLGTLRHVLAGLGLDPQAANTVTVPVAKLADAESAAWAARFLSETQHS